MTRPRGVRRLALSTVLAALVVVLLPGAGPASAHAFVVSSNPSDGQVLATAPTELRLRLSEPVVLGSTSVTLVGGSVRRELTGLRVVEAAGAGSERSGSDGAQGGGSGAAGAEADEAPVELVATLPPLERGSYRVSVETFSADDLHRTAAVLVFGVREQVAAAGRQEVAPRLDEALLRWVVLAGLSLGLGSGLLGRLARPAAHQSLVRVRAAADHVAAAGCGMAALTALALLVVQVSGEGSAGLEVLRGAYGARWATREAGLLLLAAAAALRWRRQVPRGTLLVFTTGALLATSGEALLGHAGAGTTTSWTRVAATALHVGAAATWLGAAVLLTGCTLVLRREGVPGRALARSLLRRFGLPAAACVSVMLVTGLLLASNVVASVDALLVTDYGRVLLTKTALATVALLLGLTHALSLHPRLRLGRHTAVTAARTPGRSLVAEGGAATMALALAAVLAAGQPAIGPGLVVDPAAAFEPTTSAFAEDLQEQVSIQPNRPGPNIVVVTVSSTRRPDPAPVVGVSVSLQASGSGWRAVGTGERSAPGQWSIPVTLTGAGRASATVTVTRVGRAPTVLPLPWVVAQSVPSEPVVSLASVQGWLRGAAAALGLALLLAWVVGGLRSWRRRRTPATLSVAALLAAPVGPPVRAPAGEPVATPDEQPASGHATSR